MTETTKPASPAMAPLITTTEADLAGAAREDRNLWIFLARTELNAQRAALAAAQETPDTHESGCPAIADDDSDHVLSDYGVCVCTRADKWRVRCQQAEAKAARLETALRRCLDFTCMCGDVFPSVEQFVQHVRMVHDDEGRTTP